MHQLNGLLSFRTLSYPPLHLSHLIFNRNVILTKCRITQYNFNRSYYKYQITLFYVFISFSILYFFSLGSWIWSWNANFAGSSIIFRTRSLLQCTNTSPHHFITHFKFFIKILVPFMGTDTWFPQFFRENHCLFSEDWDHWCSFLKLLAFLSQNTDLLSQTTNLFLVHTR